MAMTWGMIISVFLVVHMLSVMFLCDHVDIDKIRCGLSEWIELSWESRIVGK